MGHLARHACEWRQTDRQEKVPGASESLGPGLAGRVLPPAQDVLP